MGRRQANYRRVKIHRNYSVEEIARLFDIHKNTVRAWLKAGLPTCDEKRPKLILGRHLASFLQDRRAKRKRPCRLGEIYCLRCRTPKIPAANIADFEPVTEKIGNLVAICPDCTSMMNQRVSVAKLGSLQEKMDIAFPLALRRIGESHQATANSDLK